MNQVSRNNTRKNNKSALRTAARNVVEVLEGRQLMSATWSSGNLTVNGTNAANTIIVQTMPAGLPGLAFIQVTEDGNVTQPWIMFNTSKDVTVNGKGGADNISCAGADVAVTVDGGTGNDKIQGGSKNDTLKGGDNNDTIYGREGNDTLFGGNNDDTLNGGAGADQLIGHFGIDTADYGNRNASLMLTIDGAANDGEFLECDTIYTDVENLIGGDGNDFMMGDADANKLMGGEGDDVIYGAGGADKIYGGLDTDAHIAGVTHQERDVLNGGDGTDTLYATVNGRSEIFGGNQDDKIYGSYGRDELHGDAGHDTIEGGWADDILWGGEGDDTLKGGKGDDTLVTIGGGLKDKPWGNEGFDTFWMDQQSEPHIEDTYDASMEEVSAGHIHRIESFNPLHYSTLGYEELPPNQIDFVDKSLNGDNIADPMQTNGGNTWKNFSDNPLFPNNGVGPVPGDVRQGQVGDCWIGTALTGVARANPDRIKQTVVDLGDGTYAVDFGAGDVYRVDADLPVDGNGKTIYMGVYAAGSKGSAIWPAIIEKAFAFYRESKGTYKSLESGVVSEGYTALGCTNANGYGFNSSTQLINWVAQQRADGKPVSIGTWDSINGDGGPVFNDHAYDVVKVNKDANGNCVSVELRNPWGYDGKSDGSNPNDGYVTLTKAQFWTAAQSIWTANV